MISLPLFQHDIPSPFCFNSIYPLCYLVIWFFCYFPLHFVPTLSTPLLLLSHLDLLLLNLFCLFSSIDCFCRFGCSFNYHSTCCLFLSILFDSTSSTNSSRATATGFFSFFSSTSTATEFVTFFTGAGSSWSLS